MANSFNKKLSELLGKMDDKVLTAKINAAIEMLKNGDHDELAKKLSKVDKNEMLEKLSEIDDEKIKELKLNKSELQQKMNSVDLDAVQKLLGENGPEIMSKIKDIIK
ncbi:MAG: membrane trafficking protein [Clostridiaceae bacterium]|nr:membrane trafficking protein [Clostridiaceae bacterium]